jgi:hypothetical protein
MHSIGTVSIVAMGWQKTPTSQKKAPQGRLNRFPQTERGKRVLIPVRQRLFTGHNLELKNNKAAADR